MYFHCVFKERKNHPFDWLFYFLKMLIILLKKKHNVDMKRAHVPFSLSAYFKQSWLNIGVLLHGYNSLKEYIK